MSKTQTTLNSGNTCNLIQIKKDLIPNYYILSFPKSQGEPSTSDVTEMLNLGVAHAQDLAFEKSNDKEAFSILYSGYSAQRDKGCIFILFYLVIVGKKHGCILY